MNRGATFIFSGVSFAVFGDALSYVTPAAAGGYAHYDLRDWVQVVMYGLSSIASAIFIVLGLMRLIRHWRRDRHGHDLLDRDWMLIQRQQQQGQHRPAPNLAGNGEPAAPMPLRPVPGIVVSPEVLDVIGDGGQSLHRGDGGSR